EYQDLKQHLEDTRLETLRTAKQQAKALLVNTNQQIEATIGEIRRGNADKEVNKAAREKLETFVKKELQIEPPKPKATRERAVAGALQAGDKVALFGQDGHGEVISVKGQTAEVLFGGMKTLTKLSQLEKLGRAEIREREQAAKSKAGRLSGGSTSSGGNSVNITDRMAGFSPTLDLRGERAEDALTKTMSFVDDAVMLGMPEIRFLHGRGNGVLRQVVRDYLRSQRAVASVADEHADRGGDGVTIAVLK
ncbi:MAG: Smr/MutS family protein, partial [Bacteroidota bacterium]|nr:Smr/MutS family protein [Bacteroidota bacterium]